MRIAKLAALVALLAGAAWVAAAADSWGEEGLGARSETLWTGGLVGFALASGLVGYAAVTRSPLWLRTVVFLCAGALGASVLSVVDVGYSHADRVVGGLGGAVILLGLVGLVRRTRRTRRTRREPRTTQAPRDDDHPRQGRRAAR